MYKVINKNVTIDRVRSGVRPGISDPTRPVWSIFNLLRHSILLE